MITIRIAKDTATPKLRMLPAEIERRRHGALKETLGRAKADVAGNSPVDTGRFRSGLTVEITGGGPVLTGTVKPSPDTLVYARVLEFGRRPGAAPPPTSAIAPWVARHLGDPGLAFVVARAIGRRGLKPRHLFANAAERMRHYAPSIFGRWLKF